MSGREQYAHLPTCMEAEYRFGEMGRVEAKVNTPTETGTAVNGHVHLWAGDGASHMRVPFASISVLIQRLEDARDWMLTHHEHAQDLLPDEVAF